MIYEFSNESAQVMVKLLRNLENSIDSEERIRIKIGKCFESVDFPILI